MSNQANTITLNIFGKKKTSKDGTKSWISYSTEIYLQVKGEEEKGRQLKSIEAVIVDKELKAKLDKMKGRIKLSVMPTDITIPAIWNVREETLPDGKVKKNYPKVFIRAAIDAVLNPKPVHQDSFPVDEEEDY